MQAEGPQFLVQRESRFRGYWEALGVLCGEEFRSHHGQTTRLPIGLVESQARPPTRAVFSSALFHFSMVLFLVRVPLGAILPGHELAPRKPSETVYSLRKLTLSDYFPNFKLRGPGGHPGRGNRPDRPPARGSMYFHPRLEVISSPAQPDNNTQTILQPSSPPDLRIQVELRLPNVLIKRAQVAPKLPAQTALRPAQPAPSKDLKQSIAPALAPPAVPSEIALALPAALTQEPHLPVPAPPLPALSQVAQAKQPTGTSGVGGTQTTQEGQGDLLILNVNPANAADLLRLLPGNRYGAFSISPAGGRSGSPSGAPGGDAQGGSGGAGSGGDESSGVGPGSSGGGGTSSATNVPISVFGSTGARGGGTGGAEGNAGAGVSGAWGALPALGPGELIYPVLTPLRLRRPGLLVSTGPIGGAGLRVYGVLRGNKIYTVYLPMPGKNWILEYCFRENSHPQPARSEGGAMVVELAAPVAPPFAEEKFDFRRSAVPEEKANQMFVLHGVLREDGSVGELKVLQGIQPEADELALAAFGRWRFKPALRGGKPVAVEILVGIPAMVPQSQKTEPK